MLSLAGLTRLILHCRSDFVVEQAHASLRSVRILLQAEDFELVEVVLLPVVIGVVPWLILDELEQLLPPRLRLGASTGDQSLFLPSTDLRALQKAGIVLAVTQAEIELLLLLLFQLKAQYELFPAIQELHEVLPPALLWLEDVAELAAIHRSFLALPNTEEVASGAGHLRAQEFLALARIRLFVADLGLAVWRVVEGLHHQGLLVRRRAQRHDTITSLS